MSWKGIRLDRTTTKQKAHDDRGTEMEEKLMLGGGHPPGSPDGWAWPEVRGVERPLCQVMGNMRVWMESTNVHSGLPLLSQTGGIPRVEGVLGCTNRRIFGSLFRSLQ